MMRGDLNAVIVETESAAIRYRLIGRRGLYSFPGGLKKVLETFRMQRIPGGGRGAR
jgi:hypothetical protein